MPIWRDQNMHLPRPPETIHNGSVVPYKEGKGKVDVAEGARDGQRRFRENVIADDQVRMTVPHKTRRNLAQKAIAPLFGDAHG